MSLRFQQQHRSLLEVGAPHRLGRPGLCHHPRQALRLGVEAGHPLSHCVGPAVQAAPLGAGPLHRRLQGPQLGTDLGRRVNRRFPVRAVPPGVHVGRLIRQGRLGVEHLRLAGLQGEGVGVGGHQLLGQTGRLRLQAGHHITPDRGGQGAGHPPTPLLEQRAQPCAPGPQGLGARHRLAQVGYLGPLPGRPQPLLHGRDVGVEAGQGGSQAPLDPVEIVAQGGAGGEPGLDDSQLPTGQVAAQGGEVGDQAVMAPGGVGLLLQRTQLAADLAQQVTQAHQGLLGGFQPSLRALLATPVLEDAGRLLDDHPAVLGAGAENGVEVALGDDHVLLAADTAVGEQLLDVEEPARGPVDGVVGLAGAKQGAGDGDLGEPDGQVPTGVVDGE